MALHEQNVRFHDQSEAIARAILLRSSKRLARTEAAYPFSYPEPPAEAAEAGYALGRVAARFTISGRVMLSVPPVRSAGADAAH